MNVPRRRTRACAAWLAVSLATGAATARADDTRCLGGAAPERLAPVRWLQAPDLRAPGFTVLTFVDAHGRPQRAHVYRPTRFEPATGRLWFVMHGAERDADRYLRAAAPVAERHQALAIALEYARADHPRGDDYTLGLVTHGAVDGAALGEGRWRAPDRYGYVEVERVFEGVRHALGGRQTGYALFGHSAGAQFVHRLVTFMPCARIERAVAANAGWYTLPSAEPRAAQTVPYGLHASPHAGPGLARLLAAPLTVLLGTRDDADPSDDPLLRATRAAMAQGATRLARGEHYVQVGRRQAAALGVPFGWRLVHAQGAGHRVDDVIASAGHLLFGADPTPCSAHAAAAVQLAIVGVQALPPEGTAGDLNRDGRRHAAEDARLAIVNRGSTPACLAHWTLQDARGRVRHRVPIGPALAPGQTLVLFGGGVPTGDFDGASVQVATSSAGLGAPGADVTLTWRDPDGAPALTVPWQPWPWPGAPRGGS